MKKSFEEANNQQKSSGWKRVLRWVFAIIGAILLAILLYGVAIEPRFIIDEVQTSVNLSKLPDEWNGEEVAVISDFQIGMWLDNVSMVRKIVQRLVERQPAAVLLLGDYVYHPIQDKDKEIETLVELVKPLAVEGIPIYAVLGSHDYSVVVEGDQKSEALAREITTALESVGITVLNNEALPAMDTGNTSNTTGLPLYIVGIGPLKPKEDDIRKAFKDVPEDAPRIVMMHNPDTFGKIPAGLAPLAVAGHTHGGQVRIPFLEEWSWLSLVREGEAHADGWIKNYGAAGNKLYVNRGIGFSLVPVRINCPPEITIITLLKD